MKKYILSFIFLSLLLSSCEKAFIESSANGDNQEEVFEEFWKIFNEKYAMFESKGVDWQAAYDDNITKVTSTTSDEELFEVMGDMVLSLRDGHTSLIDFSRDTVKSFDILKGAPYNSDAEMFINYTEANFIGETKLFENFLGFYNTIDDNIGYVALATFLIEMEDSEIDTILTDLKDTKGLIIDLRDNTGGDPVLASRWASRFTDKEVETGFERFKTGPKEDDFTDSPALNKPSNGVRYSKPVMVLINGYCYSAATTFIYQTNPLEQVTFIGSRTGGGSGSVADGFLSNGWKYSLSTSEFIDYENRHLDDGFDPDIEVFLDVNDMQTDEVIARAIQEINK